MRNFVRTIAILSALALLAASCGSSGDPEEEASSSVPSSTTTALPESPDSTVEGDGEATVNRPDSESETVVEAGLASTAANDSTPELVAQECVGEAPESASCYTVSVPADWDNPESDQIILPVTVLAAQGETVMPDPIVVPSGGPGYSGATRYWWSTYPHNDERDMIVYDQRGTGAAVPSLACPELIPVEVANFQRAESLEVELASVVDAALECRGRLEADGVNLNDYDSEASVRDLDAIRRALGYDEWNILGVSYGSRLALAAMRSTPDSVRAVILDSVYDVTRGGLAANAASGDRAIAILVEQCASDAGCSELYGDLEASITSVYDMYNAEPVSVELDVGEGAGPQTFVLTGDDIIGGLYLALYNANFVGLLPSVITDLSNGNTGILAIMLDSALERSAGVANAMEWSVDCADNAGVNQADDAFQANPGRYSLVAMEPSCDVWTVEPTSTSFNDPVLSEVPALVVAGLFDPVTPWDRSQAVAGHLANATFALFVNQGHGVTGLPCADEIELGFLADPGSAPDLTCLDAVEPMAFS